MTEEPLLAELGQLSPAQARSRLRALAREEGASALGVLHRALEEPHLAEAAVAALGEIPTQEAWELLQEVADSGAARSLRKTARRSQHRLRSRGFQPAAVAPDRPQARPQVELARASFFDAAGNQLLQLTQRAPLGMRRFAEFIVGPNGLASCRYLAASQADVEELIAARDSQMPSKMVEIGWAYVARRVREAADRNQEEGRQLPEDYFDAARLLKDAPQDSRPPALEEARHAEGRLALTEVEQLLDHPSMLPWHFSPQKLAPYASDWIRQVEQQPVRTEEGIPNLGALRARGKMTSQVLQEVMEPELPPRLTTQLEEQARLLEAQEESDFAQIAMRCAASLERDPSRDNLFLRTLLEYSMDLAIELVQEQRQKAEQERGPWSQKESPSGSLWVPRDASADSPDAESPPLWLPGQE